MYIQTDIPIDENEKIPVLVLVTIIEYPTKIFLKKCTALFLLQTYHKHRLK